MLLVFGEQRQSVMARELTKTYETIRRAPLHKLAEWVEHDQNQQKGEMVVLIEGAREEAPDDGELQKLLQALVDELPVKQAAMIASRVTGLNRNELYARALSLKGDK